LTDIRRYGFYRDVKTVQIYRNPDPAKARWTRLCLPATSPNLSQWKQLNILSGGNPWKYNSTINELRGVGTIRINSGTNVIFWYLDYSSNFTEKDGKHPGFSYSLDKPNKKFTTEFILDNDQEETSVIEIYDDDETFWSVYQSGGGSFGVTLSEETTIKTKGTSSLKMAVAAGSFAEIGAQHSYGAGQDWSSKEFLALYFYGTNNGETWKVQISDAPAGGPGYREYHFVNNFSGWKRLVFGLANPTVSGGSLNLAAVRSIFVYTSAPVSSNVYLDRTLIDVGQWARIELYIPDLLDTAVRNVRIYSWNGIAYDATPFFQHDIEDNVPAVLSDRTKLFFLNAVTGDKIASADQNIMEGWGRGVRGQTKNGLLDAGNQITYGSNYGCKQRTGFAIKMPPDDGQDSGTGGISQVRIKVEVYYANGSIANGAGEATYEFSDDTNQYTGLRNINKKYLLLFHNSTAGIADFLQIADLTVGQGLPNLLELTSDHDESIIQVKVGWAVIEGDKVSWGQELEDNPATDADTDNIPDFIEGQGSISGIEPFVNGGGFS
jgi:hypothetical protein